MALLDLVALATVADVAPLTGLNRAFVRQGLKVMARRDRPGLRALADVARMDQAPTPYALGFLLGPRVNAGGRIGQADLGARLLATDNEMEATRIAARLDQLNTDRREITELVSAKRPWPRPKRVAWTPPWSGPPPKAGTPASSALSPPG
jgi:single-stranded-DNA-specific exonuclease